MSGNAAQIVSLLRANQTALRARGVLHAAIFGSVARGEARPDSDLDVMVEFDPGRGLGIYDMVAIAEEMSALLGRRVDITSARMLKPIARQHALSEKLDAF